MSDQLTALTGSGGTVTIGGRLLTIRQLTLGDWGMLRARMKEKMPRPMATFIEEMKAILPMKEFDPEGYEKCRERLLIQAHEDELAGKAGGTPAGVTEAASSMESIAYMLWLSCRRDHPAETVESLQAGLDSENIDLIKEKLDLINLAWMPEQAKKRREEESGEKKGQKVPMPA